MRSTPYAGLALHNRQGLEPSWRLNGWTGSRSPRAICVACLSAEVTAAVMEQARNAALHTLRPAMHRLPRGGGAQLAGGRPFDLRHAVRALPRPEQLLAAKGALHRPRQDHADRRAGDRPAAAHAVGDGEGQDLGYRRRHRRLRLPPTPAQAPRSRTLSTILRPNAAERRGAGRRGRRDTNPAEARRRTRSAERGPGRSGLTAATRTSQC